MKNILPLLVFLFLGCFAATAQNDTVYYYYAKDYSMVSKDSAYTFSKVFLAAGKWYSKEYYAKNNSLKSEGNYTGQDAKVPNGTFKNYLENGTLDNISEWDDGKAMEKTYYYKNGNKKAWISYVDKGSSNQQKGWDENGKEIKNYVVEREARFKGGPQGWRKYLEKHLNANVAADAGAPAGMYPVKLQFVVDKEGNVSKVKAVEIPAACKPCAAEAVNAISTGPQWENAIQNNVPVIYQAIQFITFVVVDDSKKGKKS